MNLGIFNNINLYSASADLFQQLGIKVNSNTSEPLPIEGLLKQHLKDTEIFKSINQTFFIGIIEDSVFQQMSLFKGDYSYNDALQQADKSYDGLMFFALELAKHPTRTEISELTRAFNRISQKMPVALILKYNFEKETALSITISERFKYKQNWRQGEKTGKVIILRDVKTINTHAGHQRILLDLVKPVGVTNFAQLHEHWLQVLDVSVLNKQFYQKLFNWYLWALTKAEFPQIRPEEDKIKNDVHQSESLIRLLSRLLFCWFMKEKGLINPNLFNIDYLRKTLKGFAGIKSEETIYYKAILQNLFFATLNKPIDERKIIDKGFNKKEYGDPLVYRYEELFKDDKSVLSHFENIPFLNGGLFDCLDQKKDKDNPVEIRLDGFSTKKDKQPIMPDMFFFGEYDGIDLSEEYDDKRKNKVKVFGLVDILHQYKFTIEENTPLEEEIALDPELLGKVFENLLASYNPETKTTARKQTGSFYTPREIVNYMVDESLLCYLKNTVDDEERLRNLFSYNETVNPFDKKETRQLIEAINTAKILDPACGSGAFPMGVLQKLIHVLHKLDPQNKIWFELVIANFPAAMQNVARQRLEKENWNFVRKLGIIQECIYGVDIQPIAIQISKLRFFISLLVDQTERPKEPNRGFEPLPNLDFKLIAANTLIAAPDSDTVIIGLFGGQIDPFFEEFAILTTEYFNVHLPREKKDKKHEILKLIDKKIEEKKQYLKRAKEVNNIKQTKDFNSQIELWNSYTNLFKQESVGFFEIKYFFPKVIGNFNVVIGNPPYHQVSKGIFSKERFPYSEGKDQGKQNLYKVFVETSYNLVAPKGCACMIVQSSLLCDLSSTYTRELLIDKCSLDKIIEFPKKSVESDGQVFESVLQGTCIYSFIKEIPSSIHNFSISIGNNTKSIFSLEFETVNQSSLKSLYPNSYYIPLVKKGDFAIMKKALSVSHSLLKDTKSIRQGDLNLTAAKEMISEKQSGVKLYRGRNIGRYVLNSNSNEYVNTTFLKEKVALNEVTQFIVGQEITGTTDYRRLHFCLTLLKDKFLFGHTANKIHLKNQNQNDSIVAFLNSSFLDWYFRKTSTNNHVMGYEIEQLPIPDLIDLKVTYVSKIVQLLKKEFDPNNNILIQFFERLIDTLVYEHYLSDDIKVAGCNILEHLTDLPELKQEWATEQKLKTIEKLYKQLNSPSHPVAIALFKIDTIAEIRIIENLS